MIVTLIFLSPSHVLQGDTNFGVFFFSIFGHQNYFVIRCNLSGFVLVCAGLSQAKVVF